MNEESQPDGSARESEIRTQLRGKFLITCFNSIARRPLMVLVVISLLKLVGLALLFVTDAYHPFVGSNATDHYLPIADRLLSEGSFNGPDSRPDSKVPPGYPLLLAVAKAIGESAYLQVIVFTQVLIDLGVAWGILVLGRFVNTERMGLVAGMVWLVYPPQVLISTWITAETAFTGLLLLSVILLYIGMTKGGYSYPLVAGMILGLATYFRATCLYFPVFFLIVITVCRGRRGLLPGFCLAVGCYSIVLPWTLRNYLVLGDRIAMSVGGGSVMLQGSDSRFFTIEGKRKHYPIVYQEAAEAGLTKPGGDKESAIDGWLMRIGLRQYEQRLRERPVSFAPLLLHKLARLGYGTESGTRVPQLFLGLCSLLIVPAAIWQIWMWRRVKPEAALLFGSLLAYFILLHILTLPEYRYSHPLFPLLILAATCRVSAAFERRPVPSHHDGPE